MLGRLPWWPQASVAATRFVWRSVATGAMSARTRAQRLDGHRKTLLSAGLALGLGGLVAALAAPGRDAAPAPQARAAPPRGVVSHITQVTVYPNNALVTRE